MTFSRMSKLDGSVAGDDDLSILWSLVIKASFYFTYFFLSKVKRWGRFNYTEDGTYRNNKM